MLCQVLGRFGVGKRILLVLINTPIDTHQHIAAHPAPGRGWLAPAGVLPCRGNNRKQQNSSNADKLTTEAVKSSSQTVKHICDLHVCPPPNDTHTHTVLTTLPLACYSVQHLLVVGKRVELK